MKMIEIKAKAKKMGIKVNKLKKADLIRKIQSQEGNHPCFQTSDGSCDQKDCCWRDDCLA